MTTKQKAEVRGGSRIAAARDRFSRRRWRGRLGRWRGPLIVVGLVALVGGGGWLVFWSTALDVDGVSVEGTHLLTPADVERAAAVPVGQPLARVDLDAVTARVESLPPVASAKVTRDWPATVRVVVTERRAVAVVEQGGDYRGIDAEGVLFRSYRAAPDRLPLVRSDDLTDFATDGSDGLGDDSAEAAQRRDDALREVALVVESLPAAVARKVDHVELASLDSIELVLGDGSLVRWGSADDSGLKAEVLAALMSVPATTYDVSVPGLPTTSG